MSTLKIFLEGLLEKTLHKLKQRIAQEYNNLEQVGPAPGRPNLQHDKMVRSGLCKRAAANEDKNRYCNLFPFDTSIYEFTSGVKKDQYINASWIDFQDGLCKYIVTIAPLDPRSFSYNDESTIPDFWQMCWETKVQAVVMLCTVSPGFTGCSQYFPDTLGTTARHGKFTVKHEKSFENSSAGFVEREFTLRKEDESGREHRIYQFHYQAWPNYGIPESGVTDFVYHVHKRTAELNFGTTESAMLERNEPRLVVHCSGGIGRSGTFLASFVAYCKLQELCKNSVADPVFKDGVFLQDIVMKMRTQRHPWMVEGLHQYRVAYDIVVEMIKNKLKSFPSELN